MKMSKTLEAKISDYIDTKSQFEKYKRLEREQRVSLLDHVFPNAGQGTLTEDIGPFNLKGGFSVNMRLDKKLLEENLEYFSDEERECIRYKPEIAITAYKALDVSDKPFLDECITISPSLPSLKIEVIAQ